MLGQGPRANVVTRMPPRVSPPPPPHLESGDEGASQPTGLPTFHPSDQPPRQQPLQLPLQPLPTPCSLHLPRLSTLAPSFAPPSAQQALPLEVLPLPLPLPRTARGVLVLSQGAAPQGHALRRMPAAVTAQATTHQPPRVLGRGSATAAKALRSLWLAVYGLHAPRSAKTAPQPRVRQQRVRLKGWRRLLRSWRWRKSEKTDTACCRQLGVEEGVGGPRGGLVLLW